MHDVCLQLAPHATYLIHFVEHQHCVVERALAHKVAVVAVQLAPSAVGDVSLLLAQEAAEVGRHADVKERIKFAHLSHIAHQQRLVRFHHVNLGDVRKGLSTCG